MDQVKLTKVLDAIICDKHFWFHHIVYIKNKLAKGILILRKTRTFLNTPSMTILYNCFIYLYIRYGVEVWGCACDCYIQQIIKLQKRSVKIMSSSKTRSHTAPVFKSPPILLFPKCYFLLCCKTYV